MLMLVGVRAVHTQCMKKRVTLSLPELETIHCVHYCTLATPISVYTASLKVSGTVTTSTKSQRFADSIFDRITPPPSTI